MSILDTIEHWWKDTEADVLTLIAEIKKGVGIAEADLAKANAWVIANAPTITSDIESVLAIVASLSGAGIALPASVTAAAAAATEATAALNAYVGASGSGSTTAAALIAGYTAVKQAAAAHANAAIAVAGTPAKAAA